MPSLAVVEGGNGISGIDSPASARSPSGDVATIIINPPFGTAGVFTDVSGTLSQDAPVRTGAIEFANSPRPQAAREFMPTAKLYPLRAVVSPDLELATRTVESGLAIIEEAIAAVSEEQAYAIDDAMIRLASVLPDLFLCRSLGDGFAALVVALHYGLTNPRDVLPTLDQLQEIRLTFRYLREQPFIKHELAIERIIGLEDSGLTVDPVLAEGTGSV